MVGGGGREEGSWLKSSTVELISWLAGVPIEDGEMRRGDDIRAHGGVNLFDRPISLSSRFP